MIDAREGRLSWVEEWVRGTIRDPAQHFQSRAERHCSCCGYSGYFVSARRRHAREFRCPWCKSRPRDRFLTLLLERYGVADTLLGKRVLHFAPEWPLFNRLKSSPTYIGADIRKRPNANAVLDITAIEAADRSVDVLICNHVLEHVPDHKLAMRECRRVLDDGGIAFFSVPLDLNRPVTWEPPAGTPVEEIERICGWDHKRLYGLDFADMLAEAGFSVQLEYVGEADAERYRLLADDVFFVGRIGAA